MNKAKVFRGTWLGRPGMSIEFPITGTLRVIEHRWSDEITASVRLVEGDGRKPDTFVEYINVDGLPLDSGLALAKALAEGNI